MKNLNFFFWTSQFCIHTHKWAYLYHKSVRFYIQKVWSRIQTLCLLSQTNFLISNPLQYTYMYDTYPLMFEKCFQGNTSNAHMCECIDHFCCGSTSKYNCQGQQEIANMNRWAREEWLTMPCWFFIALLIWTPGFHSHICSTLSYFYFWIISFTKMAKLKK